jgi:hypothetical protein
MPAKWVSTHGDTATVSVPVESIRRSSLKEGDELETFSPGGPVVLLTGGSRPSYFAGSLEAISPAELSGFLCASMRTGTLVIERGGLRKTVSFREGQVCHATSSDPSDRLGEVLWRNRMLDLSKLREVEHLVKPGLQLGKLLTTRGTLTAAQLYRGLQMQVKEIVLGIFVHREGNFAFTEGEVEAAVIKIPERVRDLVLSGITRADEVSSLLRVYPRSAIFEATGAKLTIDPHGGVLLAMLDGKRSVGEVLMASRLGDYTGLKALAVLEQARVVRRTTPAPKPSQPEPRPDIPVQAIGPVEIYEDIFGRLAAMVRTVGGGSAVLNSFFDQLPRDLVEVFKGVRFDESGRIDVRRVMPSFQDLQEDVAERAHVLDALDTLVMFALFEIRNAMPAEAGRQLAREIDRLQRGVSGAF